MNAETLTTHRFESNEYRPDGTHRACQFGEYQYLELLQDLLEFGDPRMDRTGVGTRSLFGRTMRFDLAHGFPVLTTKKVPWRTGFKEMLWMLGGGRNIRELLEQNVHFWTDWPLKRYREQTGDYVSKEVFEQRVLGDRAFADQWGDLGPIGYGHQWRRWRTESGLEIDQVEQVIDQLMHNPTSRRILWEGWNVGDIAHMALPPCHKTYQFYVRGGTHLCGAVQMRSSDAFLGLPVNLSNLALVTHMLAEQTGYAPGEILYVGVDVHAYENHISQIKTQLARTPRVLPRLRIRRRPLSLFDYRVEDFELEGYDPHPAIKAPVAV